MEPNQLMVQIERTSRTVEVWQQGTGRDLVYLHGAGGLNEWTRDLELLSKSFRVTAPIHPGFGRSDGVDAIDSVLDSVLHTFDVLDQLEIRLPHLMGHSMGGMIAAEMGAICPNDIASLTLVCPIGLWDDGHPVLDFFTLLPVDLVQHIFYDKSHPAAQAMGVTPTSDEQVVDMYTSYLKGLSAAGRLLWPIPDRGLRRRIHRIKAPALVLWGEADGLVPVFYADEFARLIRGARVQIVREASHMVLPEKPEASVRIVREFVDSVGAPARAEARAAAASVGVGAAARTKRNLARKKTAKPAQPAQRKQNAKSKPKPKAGRAAEAKKKTKPKKTLRAASRNKAHPPKGKGR